MEYSPTLNPLFCFPTGIVIILDFLTFPLYLRWIKSGKIKKSRLIFLVKPFSLAVCIYFLFTQFGAGALPGAWYFLIAPVIALGMLLYFLTQIIKEKDKKGSLTRADWINFSLGILLIISIAAPSFLFRPITKWCDSINSKKNIPVISEAVQKYYAKNGSYPVQMWILVPDYIDSIPEPSCSLLSGAPRTFELNQCNPPYVFVKTIDFVGHDLYNLKDGSIIHLGSFFDTGPYYCP